MAQDRSSSAFSARRLRIRMKGAVSRTAVPASSGQKGQHPMGVQRCHGRRTTEIDELVERGVDLAREQRPLPRDLIVRHWLLLPSAIGAEPLQQEPRDTRPQGKREQHPQQAVEPAVRKVPGVKGERHEIDPSQIDMHAPKRRSRHACPPSTKTLREEREQGQEQEPAAPVGGR